MSKAIELARKVLEKQDTSTGDVWIFGPTQLEAFYEAAQKEQREALHHIDYFAVFDDENLPAHITLTHSMAHDHIKEMEFRNPDADFSKWRVVPVTIAVPRITGGPTKEVSL